MQRKRLLNTIKNLILLKQIIWKSKYTYDRNCFWIEHREIKCPFVRIWHAQFRFSINVTVKPWMPVYSSIIAIDFKTKRAMFACSKSQWSSIHDFQSLVSLYMYVCVLMCATEIDLWQIFAYLYFDSPILLFELNRAQNSVYLWPKCF